MLPGCEVELGGRVRNWNSESKNCTLLLMHHWIVINFVLSWWHRCPSPNLLNKNTHIVKIYPSIKALINDYLKCLQRNVSLHDKYMVTQLWSSKLSFIAYLEAERQHFSFLCIWNIPCLPWTPGPDLPITDTGAFGRWLWRLHSLWNLIELGMAGHVSMWTM